MKRPNNSGAPAHEARKHYDQRNQLYTGGSRSSHRARLADLVMPRDAALLIAFLVCAGIAGCSFLKPAPDMSRHFVLSSLPATETANGAPGAAVVGVVHVKIPTYLFNSSLAVRKSANEIEYPPATLWAERLDTGIPRVLAADLASLLPKDQFRVSVGGGENAAMEIGVTIEQFDVSLSGQAVLVAKWRILSPGGEKILRVGESHLSRNGPAPDANPAGAVGTLSGLIADLGRQLAQALSTT